VRQFRDAVQCALLVTAPSRELAARALVVEQQLHPGVARGEDGFEDGRPRVVRRVLRQVPGGEAVRAGHAPGVRPLKAGDEAEERGLAGAVDPDHADAVVTVEAEADVFEDGPQAVVLADRFDG
jgi:hypothetical protein